MLSQIKLIAITPVLFAAAIIPLKPITQALPVADNIAQYLVVPPKPQFPDMTTNYTKTIIEPREAAQQAAEAAQQALVVTYTTPTPQPAYGPPADGYKAFIYNHESGNNPGAVNPYSGACGLGQALPCSKLPCLLTDYNCQDAWFTSYALSRYGSWEAAYYFWLGHSWW